MYTASQKIIFDIFLHVVLFCRNVLVYEEMLRQMWLPYSVILIQSTAIQIPYRSLQTVFFVEVSYHNISSSPSTTVYVLCGSIVVKCLQYIFFFRSANFLFDSFLYLFLSS